MRILHLVLYSESKEYNRMLKTTRAFYSTCTHLCDTFYYKYDETVKLPTIDPKDSMVLCLPGKESYLPGVSTKTLDVLEFFDEEKYDYVIRSNISTVVNLNLVMKQIQAMHDENASKPQDKQFVHFYGGAHIMKGDKVPDLSFVQGTCIVLNKATVALIGAMQQHANTNLEDDVCIAKLLQDVAKVCACTLANSMPGIFLPFKLTRKQLFDLQLVAFGSCSTKKTLVNHGAELEQPTQLGAQFTDSSPYQNLGEVSAFRNHTFHSDRIENWHNMQKQVQVLSEQMRLNACKQLVKKVLYHGTDVTPHIKRLCPWSTDGTNTQCDIAFGDPAPNKLKLLMVMFEDEQQPNFIQACPLSFSVDGSNLFVN
jgi:hypothetical protein